jgi:hypothetical protein
VHVEDIDQDQLASQLDIFQTHFSKEQKQEITINDAKSFLLRDGESSQLYSQIETLLTLTLVMPATNATSERSFSALNKDIPSFNNETRKTE